MKVADSILLANRIKWRHFLINNIYIFVYVLNAQLISYTFQLDWELVKYNGVVSELSHVPVQLRFQIRICYSYTMGTRGISE